MNTWNNILYQNSSEPPGYVGHAEGGVGSGQLINDVEETPNCIVLLDEVEKVKSQA